MITEKGIRILINKALEMIIVFDKDGKIVFANPKAEEELGYEGRLAGMKMAAVLIKEFEIHRDYKTMMQAVNEKGETVCYRCNGTCFNVKAVIGCEEEEEQYYFMASDIEKSRELEQELNYVKEMAQQAVGIRSDFVANVTHELRTPVNGIRGHVENLKETCLTTEQRNTLQIITNCCDNMASLINNILDFSKLEAGKMELEENRFEIREMLRKIADANMAVINEKGLRFSVHIGEEIPQFLSGDELRLTQILNNLLSNAIKFTSVGFVKIEVAQTMRLPDEIELFFMVADSGIGIAREDQDKLFHSFSQVDSSITRRYGGTGLGLAIAKELVSLMGGKVYLESEKGRGSNFSFSVRLHVTDNDEVLMEYKKEINEFMESTRSTGDTEVKEYYNFGSEKNRKEIESRMEKLVLCIELQVWEKAELWLEELKKLVENADEEMRRGVLRLGMAIRKEDYEASMEKYEAVKQLLVKKSGEDKNGSEGAGCTQNTDR